MLNIIEYENPAMTEVSEEDNQCLNNLLAQIEPIDLLLQRQLLKLSINEDSSQKLDNFLLSHEMLDTQNSSLKGAPIWADAVSEPILSPIIMQAEADASNRVGQLFSRFKLNGIERHVLLLSLIAELDPRYHPVFCYLQEDNDKRWPTSNCLATLLCSNVAQRSQLQRMLLEDSPLFRHRLVSSVDNAGVATIFHHQRMLRVVPEVYHFLLGHTVLPTELAHCANWLSPAPDAMQTQPALIAQLGTFLEAHEEESIQLGLSGIENDSRISAVTQAASQRYMRILALDFTQLPDDKQDAWNIFTLLLREKTLGGGYLLLRNLSDIGKQAALLLPQFSQRLLEEKQVVVVLQNNGAAADWLTGMPQMVFNVQKDSLDQSVALLQANAAEFAIEPGIDFAALLTRFTLNPESVGHVVQEADLYRQHSSTREQINAQDFNKALRLRAQQNFGNLAQRIEPTRTFDDLIASDDLQLQLNEILAAIRQRGGILSKGFDKKIVYGTGISALFYGDSGTGKSMAAEVLARELKVDLIKVDLSAVVNKYIGETEKNLAKVFDLATSDAGVLFFDEADALFGKRSEVKDAQDRHANIEVSYLLQRLESYPGLVVLATNNRSHLDQAFSRRLTFITRFTPPDIAMRQKMWANIWPKDIKLAADVHFNALAHKTTLTGANIRNIALLASWLAQDNNDGVVTKAHIDLALQRELSKLGRVI